MIPINNKKTAYLFYTKGRNYVRTPKPAKDEKWTSAKSKKKSKGKVYRSNIVFVATEDDSLTASLT